MSESEEDPNAFYYPEEDNVLGSLNETNTEEIRDVNTNMNEFSNFIADQQPKSTKQKTKYDLQTWYNFCEQKNEMRKVEDIPFEQLNLLLCSFFKDVTKKNGEVYEPSTLTSFQRSIQRYLNSKGSTANLLKGDEFKLSREVLKSKKKKLVVDHGKGNRPKATRVLSEVEEDKLFAEGEFGSQNPVALQRTVWWLLALHFGFRARDESRRLLWGDVSLENDPETGNEILVWKTERGSKTRHGQDESSGRRAFYPTAQATGNERCPVMYYKMFKSHRPLLMNQPESPFYLAIKHQRNPNDNIWYKRSPLGKNEIGKLLSKAAQNAGLPGRVTNHSVRKTCISRLLDSDVPVNFVAQLSGHHNLKSLDAYKSASTQHQRKMSFALSRTENTEPSTVSSSSTMSSVVDIQHKPNQSITKNVEEAGIFHGATFENCSFNIQVMSGPVTQTPSKTECIRKRRRLFIESDSEDE